MNKEGSFGVFNPRGFINEYPGGDLQWLLDKESNSPFSRLFEQAETVTTVPADRRVRRV